MGGLEIRRIFLGLGLAVSSYLLILSWTSQPDQIRSQRLAPLETPIIESNQTTQTMDISRESIAPSLAKETDIPVLQPEQTTSLSAETSRVDLSRLVKVETNVLTVWIDLLGGDSPNQQGQLNCTNY